MIESGGSCEGQHGLGTHSNSMAWCPDCAQTSTCVRVCVCVSVRLRVRMYLHKYIPIHTAIHTTCFSFHQSVTSAGEVQTVGRETRVAIAGSRAA